MSDPQQQQPKESHITKPNGFWTGFSLGTLVVFSALDIFLLLFIVPKFEQIFADALPGKPLPTVTEFIITARIALVMIALGWPILGALLVKLQKRHAILWINVGTIWTIFQIVSAVIALYMPMASQGIYGMSDAKP